MSCFSSTIEKEDQKKYGGFEFEFDKKYTFEQRKGEAERIMKKYPGSIPIICETNTKTDIPNLCKNKYLVKSDMTVGQFMSVIRKQLKKTPNDPSEEKGYVLPPEKGLFLFVNNTLPSLSALISQIYKEHKSDDLFLRILCSGENCFGHGKI